MFRKICILLLLCGIAASVMVPKTVSAFEETGTLNGRIIDGFGQPVMFAEVKTECDVSTYSSTTNTSGNYSVSYSPGNVRMIIKKEGYVTMNIPFMVEDAGEFAIDDITIWDVPPKGGLFVVGDSEYIALNSAKFYSDSRSEEKRYYVEGSPTRVKGEDIKIIDFQTDNPLVVGKTLYSVDRKNSVGSVMFYPSRKYDLNEIDVAYKKVADNVGLRQVGLSPGKYFYCIGEITLRSRKGYGYFFEVSR